MASLAFGAGLALYALDGPADYSPPTSRVVRGLGEIINSAIYAFGEVGAAVVFVMVGVVMAGASAAPCPFGRDAQP
ncbi:hypothetical protein K3152_01245 [Qipengyuania sp. 1NDH17]|uniref:Uncharacterized protein n=1 Tax=Qipengyuania polymorpha TaxID=2867234 RepID=A0ABS7IYH4_9SPHN|nr:hypothetical protein [Qipengyuania polymorpha]MBX7456864.1 hypothetical protein [Qipengyuania polymorpha]